MINIYKTKLIRPEQRTESLHRVAFDECECCGHINNFISGDMKNGKFVKFYKKHMLALCDECVDEKNGHPWI